MNPTTSSTETKFSPCTLGNICKLIGIWDKAEPRLEFRHSRYRFDMRGHAWLKNHDQSRSMWK